ncbi:proton-conducting transporter transmembrane domain-containing protein [Pontivivens insulae]|uniref:Probable inorganic carbon transporter subunit DabB n=1 Tax=Pontivivens insulae TaxID=1639689 RepID=A0A2R8A6P8_9RHOB|nr:proton-conducting transporter membrane subunit [Pontivivens insulae]RED17995.1 NAD(P)H-quinone oxidoreductase subunit 5 [Pontivivens insulae]SPF27885.1 NADH-quinone oxidoreductase subunit L [Pontivivens insulae]
MTYPLLAYLAPLALTLASLVAFRGPGMRPAATLRFTEMASLFALAIAVLSAVVLFAYGPATSHLIGFGQVGFSVRLDIVSAAMLLLVTFIGWIVLRYSATYLDGEAEQGRFMGWMALTLAAVMLLVSAGNVVQLAVAWIGAALGLHQLLIFYADRVEARRAARKKRITAQLGDVALIAAALTLILAFGTGDIVTLNEVASGGWAIFAAILLALAAVLKSAQLPLHGWLTEVMETPTPVSALLHAGIVNAGGFLLIRFADVMLTAPGVLALLVLIGGFTALVASLVMLTQAAVKTSLAWSTIAQMGFMILQCGLALFPLALLHILAHSLYKAHAFLTSGSAVDAVAATRRPGPVAVPSVNKVLRAFGLALVIYAIMGLIFGLADKAPQAIALGAILIFGVAYLIAQGLADAAPRKLTQRTALASIAVAGSYFALQSILDWLAKGTLPATPTPGNLEWALMVLIVVGFGFTALAQAMFPLWAHHPAAQSLRVHLANGLYLNALFDRAAQTWAIKPASVKE